MDTYSRGSDYLTTTTLPNLTVPDYLKIIDSDTQSVDTGYQSLRNPEYSRLGGGYAKLGNSVHFIYMFIPQIYMLTHTLWRRINSVPVITIIINIVIIIMH